MSLSNVNMAIVGAPYLQEVHPNISTRTLILPIYMWFILAHIPVKKFNRILAK